MHVVNLNNAEKEVLNIHVKRLEGGRTLNHYKVESNSTIKDFIDGKIFETMNLNSDQVFLVYTGKQLDIQKTFL